jgi:hypothetical protein
MRGFWLIFGYICLISVWIAPVALLAQFKVLSDFWAFVLVFPVMIGGYFYVWGIVHRHSAPSRCGVRKGTEESDPADRA